MSKTNFSKTSIFVQFHLFFAVFLEENGIKTELLKNTIQLLIGSELVKIKQLLLPFLQVTIPGIFLVIHKNTVPLNL